MKKQIKKIVLSKETVRHLTADEAAGALGGSFPISGVNTCRCPSVSCRC